MSEKLKAGDVVTAYGYEWEILDPEYEGKDGPGILCLTKSLIRNMAFSEDGSNNYAESDIKKYADGSRSHNSVRCDLFGLVPACIFSRLPERVNSTVDEIEDLKKRVAELERWIKNVSVSN